MSPPNRARPRRLNARALALTALIGVAVVSGLVGLYVYQTQFRRATVLLDQARLNLKSEPPRYDLALGYLQQFLERHPEDREALALRAEALDTLAAGDPGRVADALRANEQLLRATPEDREVLRKVVALNTRAGQFQTALTLADRLPEGEAATHRLRGLAWASMAQSGIRSASARVQGEDGQVRELPVDPWERALAELERARELDPSDEVAAQALATVYLDHSRTPEKAEAVLLDLLEAHPESTAVRLALYTYYRQRARDLKDESPRREADARSQQELAEAVRLDGESVAVRLTAAEDALRRGDPRRARAHLEAIPEARRADPRVRNLEGTLHLGLHQTSQALESWRAGLISAGGTDLDLTYRLAYLLLNLGRAEEARPLVAQFHRLTQRGKEPTPLGRLLDAMLARVEGRTAEAITLLERLRLRADDPTAEDAATALKPDEGEIYLQLGRAYQARAAAGDDLHALDAFRRAGRAGRGPRHESWSEPYLAAADLLRNAGRADEAADELEQGLLGQPGSPDLLTALARLRLDQQLRRPADQRDWAAVGRILDRAAAAAPNAPELVRAQVQYLAARGQVEDAARRLETATRDAPHAVDLWVLRGQVLAQLRRPAEALRVLEQGIKEAGDAATLRIARANLLTAEGHEAAAQEALTQGLDRLPAPEQAAVQRALVELHLRRNDRAAARRAAAAWAALAPEDPQPQLMILDLAVAAGDQEAVQAALAALDRRGEATARMARASVLLAQAERAPKDPKAAERLDEADRLIGQSIADRPDRPEGHFLAARLAELRDRPDAAVDAYRLALERGQREALQPLAQLLVRRRRFDELEALRAQMPAGLEQLLAGQLIRQGDAAEAEKLASAMLQGDAAGPDAATTLAKVYNSLGKADEAEKVLRQQVAARPGELGPRLALLQFLLSRRRTDDAAKVVAAIRSEIQADRPEFLWAQLYQLLGDRAQADRYFEEARRKWPDDTAILLRAADYYRNTGQLSTAAGTLRRVLELDPSRDVARRTLALVLAASPNDPTAWQEALALTDRGGAPADRLTRATVLAAGPEPRHRQEAVTLLEGLVDDLSGPPALAARELLVRLDLAAGRKDQAADQARQLADDANPGTVALYAQVLLAADRPGDAAAQVERLAKLEPEAPRTAALRVRVARAEGHPDRARALLEAAFAAREEADDPTAAREFLGLAGELKLDGVPADLARRFARRWPGAAWTVAGALAAAGHRGEAIALCRSSVAAGTPAAQPALAAYNAALMPDPDPALLPPVEGLLREALKGQPESPPLLLALAFVRHLQGEYKDEIRYYREALAHGPADFTFLNNMAWTLSEELGQPEEGLERADEALRKLGRNPQILDTRGVILTRLGRHGEAIKDLEAATAALPDSAPLWYHLGRTYHKAGQAEKARAALDRARAAGLSPEQLQPSERPEMQELVSR